MKKSKLFGTRLVENVLVPRTPNIIILNEYDKPHERRFEEGDILDANSIKEFLKQDNTGIMKETADRIAADKRLEDLISAETSNRISADIDVNAHISNVERRLNGVDDDIKAALQQEAKDRIDGDKIVSDKVDNEAALRVSDISDVKHLISDEARHRTDEDTEIKRSISTEAANREASFNNLQTSIASEILDRKNGDLRVEGLVNDLRGEIGSADGIAPLGSDSKIPTIFLPGKVYEVLLFDGFQIVNSTQPNSTTTYDGLYFDKTKGMFFPKKGNVFYGGWPTKDLYINADTNRPYNDKIYINTSENLPYLWDGGSFVSLSIGKDSRLRRVTHPSSETFGSIESNILHIWGVVPTLSLTLAPNPSPAYVAEYCFQFTCPADRGTTLTLPSTIKWFNDYVPQIKAGKTYQASILENIIIMGEVT